MKIIIPYKDFRGTELRYCLRGIEKFISDPEITIIGDRPQWLKNVVHIPFKDNPFIKFKSRNIYEKIKGYDNFLFFNDDYFLLAPFGEETYHYSGTIKQEMSQPYMRDTYRRTLQNTFDKFGDIKNFDTHCPIFYKHLNLDLDWNQPWGYCIKSIYAMHACIEGTEYPDLKIRSLVYEEPLRKLLEGRPYFSTSNTAMTKPTITVLNELYPEKSKYES